MYFRAICSLRPGQCKLERNMAHSEAQSSIAQSVNCHIALIAMFYLLNINVNFVLAITTCLLLRPLFGSPKGVVLLAKLSQTVLTSSALIR